MKGTEVIFLTRRRIGFEYNYSRRYADVSRARAQALYYSRRKPAERAAIVCADGGAEYVNFCPIGKEVPRALC